MRKLSVVAGMKAYITARDNQQQGLLDDVHITMDAADLIIKMLELHPLSHRPPPEVRGAMSAQQCDQTSNGNSVRQRCTTVTASTQPQVSRQPELWPTPHPNEWHDIQLVTTRACMSLHWAMTFKTHGTHHITAEFVQTLTARLGQLIQCLVAGHLPDLKLDMREVFKAGLNPILMAQMVQDAECTDLAVAMMSCQLGLRGLSLLATRSTHTLYLL